MEIRRAKTFSLFSFLCLSSLATAAEAAGFYLQEQSVSAQGSAFAGAGANPNDASIIFYNPAGMTALEGPQITAGIDFIRPRSTFSDGGSTAGLTAGAQSSFANAGGGQDPFSIETVPNFYAAVPVSGGKYWVGLGISAPFGLANEYDADWFGRYDSTKSDLRTIDIAPVLAMRVNDKLSVGGGPNFQHARAILESALPCPNPAFGCGAAFDPSSDGLSRLEGDSLDIGYNVGVLWQPTIATRVGAHFRSGINNEIPGLVTISGLGGALAAFNGASAATAKLKLPHVLSFGVAHQVNRNFKILGSYNHYGWNNFDNIPVVFDNGSPSNIAPQNYRNSYSAALGAEWRQSERFTWRGGAQFDKTPTTDGDRSTRTPDGDRYWLSLGASYRLNEHVSLDAAATHIFIENGDVNLTKRIYAGTAADSTVNVNGVSDNKLDIVSLQAVWRF